MKSINRLAFSTALFSFALLSGGSAFAQKSSPPSTPPAGSPGWGSEGSETSKGTASQSSASEAPDATFVKKAASGGMAEVKLGQLAQEKGSNSTVKEFGKRMENDHSKAGDQLKNVASKNNIAVPEEIDKKDQATYDHLSKLSGAEFDRVYAQHMVTDHEKDIEEFKKEASTGKNANVKGFASKTLPTLQDHLRQAREMEKSVSARESTKKSQSY
jgi:putative membrane protein